MDQQNQNQQLLQDALSSNQQQTQQQIDTIVNKLQPQIQQAIFISAALTVVVLLIMLMNAIYKWRVERAILRMDKNLEKLLLTQDAHSQQNADKD